MDPLDVLLSVNFVLTALGLAVGLCVTALIGLAGYLAWTGKYEEKDHV